MNFYEFINMFDNWNLGITVNDSNLRRIVRGIIYDVVSKRKDLYDKKVASFGFYEGVLTVRLDDIQNLYKWNIDYIVKDEKRSKYVYALTKEDAIKKARVRNLVDLYIVDKGNVKLNKDS